VERSAKEVSGGAFGEGSERWRVRRRVLSGQCVVNLGFGGDNVCVCVKRQCVCFRIARQCVCVCFRTASMFLPYSFDVGGIVVVSTHLECRSINV